jgi:hypothetical protein
VGTDVEIGLQGHQIGHSEDAGIDGSRMFHFKSTNDRPAFDPEYIDIFNGPKRDGIIIQTFNN